MVFLPQILLDISMFYYLQIIEIVLTEIGISMYSVLYINFMTLLKYYISCESHAVISICAALSYWNQSGFLGKNQWNWSRLVEVVHAVLTLWSLNHKPEKVTDVALMIADGQICKYSHLEYCLQLVQSRMFYLPQA